MDFRLIFAKKLILTLLQNHIRQLRFDTAELALGTSCGLFHHLWGWFRLDRSRNMGRSSREDLSILFHPVVVRQLWLEHDSARWKLLQLEGHGGDLAGWIELRRSG